MVENSVWEYINDTFYLKKKKKEKGSIHGMVRITESDFLTEMWKTVWGKK